jgi:hypothetical protein
MVRSIPAQRLTRTVAVVLFALGAVAGALASQTVARRTGRPVPSVLTPRDGHRVTARPIAIRVQLGGARLVGAKLNRRGILSQLRIPGPTARPAGPRAVQAPSSAG